MNGRALLTAIYTGAPFDRLPLQGVGAWAETLSRWRREGLRAGADPNVVLGLVDDGDMLSLPLNLGMVPAFDIQILSRAPEYVTLIDEFGVTKRMLCRDFDYSSGTMSAAGTTSAMSEWLAFPVKDLASWKRLYEERFRPEIAARLPADWRFRQSWFRELARSRWVVYFSFPFGGFFSALRQLMGFEAAVFAMADNPGLIRTILTDLGDFYVATYAGVLCRCAPGSHHIFRGYVRHQGAAA